MISMPDIALDKWNVENSVAAKPYLKLEVTQAIPNYTQSINWLWFCVQNHRQGII